VLQIAPVSFPARPHFISLLPARGADALLAPAVVMNRATLSDNARSRRPARSSPTRMSDQVLAARPIRPVRARRVLEHLSPPEKCSALTNKYRVARAERPRGGGGEAFIGAD
jgi:hypothetical protein